MKLFIVHSHFRPGGVRRVIELAAPQLAAAAGAEEVVLVSGEPVEETWQRRFQKRMNVQGMTVSAAVSRGVGYLAGQRRSREAVRKELDHFFRRLFACAGPGRGVVWAHNQGLGRNLLLTKALSEAGSAAGLSLIWHHHDWWFDNRWQRWPEMRRAGFRTLAQVAQVIFPATPAVCHVAINQADASVLERHFPNQSCWLPNPAEPGESPLGARVEAARRWLQRQLGDEAPVWLMPCRLLRRKNIAEALLLMRWLRPEAWLVTTGAISSADERVYAQRLGSAAQRHHWRLRLSLLAGPEEGKPTVPELVGASEAVLLTSLQEGFGLPYLEAAEAGRPLIARALPNIAPDLARFGFAFPQYYDEILVAPGLFDWEAESSRQQRRFAQWRRMLPRSCRPQADAPALLAHGRQPAAVPFSRLTLAAQLEVLQAPVEKSWEACAALNPFLRIWRGLAAAGQLRPSRWPRSANRWLGAAAQQRIYQHLLAARPARRLDAQQAEAAQREFIARKLAPANLYPILWSVEQ